MKTCDPSIYTIDHSDFIIYSFMENSIGPKRVNEIREYEGCPSKLCTFFYNTRPGTSNSMIFKGCICIHMGNILYKNGRNHSLDNKFINLYLTVCPREQRTSKYFQ